MFSGFKRAFGYVTAETKDGIIRIEGVPTYTIQTDIRRIWGTSRIEAYMFNAIGKNSFSFNAFFALDFVYAIEKLLVEKHIRTTRRVLNNILKVLREDTWLANLSTNYPTKLNRAALAKFKKTPMEKQSDFFEVYDRITQQYCLHGMLLAAAAGSGKTISSLMLSEMLESDVTVVVSPLNAVIDVWEKTLCTELNQKPTYWHSLMGTPLKGSERYCVVHYEALHLFVAQMRKLKGKRVNVVLDESHNFNTSNTVRTGLFIDMCLELNASDVLWMSGTPIKALGSEAIPLFRSIDPLFTPDTEFRFKKIFGLSSTRGADILNSRLGIVSYKVEKKDLPIEAPEILPPEPVKIPNGHEFTMEAVAKKMADFVAERLAYYKGREKEDQAYYYGILEAHEKTLRASEQHAAYAQFRRDLKVVIANGGDARFCAEQIAGANRYENVNILPTLDRENQVRFKDIRSAVKYVKLKVRGECLGRVVAKERMRAHLEMVPYIDFAPILDSSEKKTVIFTSFVEVLERLQKLLAGQGHEALTVYGKTNTVLSATLHRFEQEEDVNPLIATYKSLSTAVPLLMADVMVLIDAPFRDYILQQTISRTSRLGATSRTTVYMFTLDTGSVPNIAGRSFDILKWSQEQIKAIIGIEPPFQIEGEDGETQLAMEELTAWSERERLGVALETMDLQPPVMLTASGGTFVHNEAPIEVTPEHLSRQPSFMDW